MPIKTECLHCGEVYSLADTQRGKKVRCKSCGESFEVRALGGTSQDLAEGGEENRVSATLRRRSGMDADSADEESRGRRSRDEEDEDRSSRSFRRRSRDDDDEPRRGSGGKGLGLLLAAAGVGVLLFGGVIVAWLLYSFLFRSPSKPTPTPIATQSAPFVPNPNPFNPNPMAPIPGQPPRKVTEGSFHVLQPMLPRQHVELILGPGKVESQTPLTPEQNTPGNRERLPVRTLSWREGNDVITAQFNSNNQMIKATATIGGRALEKAAAFAPLPVGPVNPPGIPPAPPVDGARLTKANFERLTNGMTPDQVIAILGQPSMRLGNVLQTLIWREGGTSITAGFRNNQLYSKSGQNLR